MKAAIYCRLSEEDKNKEFQTDESLSIQNQKSLLVKYAAEQDWDIYDIYSDDDYTGSDRKRPQFNRLINDAKSKKFDIILCKTQSRFTRELELVEKYINYLFPLWGIRFISVVDHADTLNKGNKKSRQINGLVNEWYLEDMSENIKSVLTNRRLNGYHIGSFAPYGYKKDPDKKGHLVPDEPAAKIVREIFTLFSKGYGKTAIARILNEKHIPNPTEYKRLQGMNYKQPFNKNSTLWKYYSISNILSNEVYIGNLVQGKYGSISYKTKQNKPRAKETWYIVNDTHEAIIDKDLWNNVQKLIKNNTHSFNTSQIGLFAQKARCAYCGYTMRSTKTKGKQYLKCPTKHIAKDACKGSFISVDLLQSLVITEINKLTDCYLDKNKLESSLNLYDKSFDTQTKFKNEITKLKNKIYEYDRMIKQLYLDKLKGIISEENYISFSKEFNENREQIKNTITEHERQIFDLENRQIYADYKKAIINPYIKPQNLTREMLDYLIDYIVIKKRISGTRNVPIEIHWNF